MVRRSFRCDPDIMIRNAYEKRALLKGRHADVEEAGCLPPLCRTILNIPDGADNVEMHSLIASQRGYA